ncbi:MAG: class I SAM-dependent methyltransferase [bacterium]
MKVSKYYNSYWLKHGGKNDFLSYERNLVLPDLFIEKETVLDLACGEGIVSEYLQNNKGIKIIGADISERALKIAQGKGIKTVRIDIEKKLPFKDHSFDCVFWGDNIEHLFDPEQVLKEINRVLKDKGRLILSFPNIAYWRYRIFHLITGNIEDTEWSGNPPWKWLHIRFFNLSILSKLLSKCGFKIRKKIGVSKRLPDKIILPFMATLFGMILIVEAKKV